MKKMALTLAAVLAVTAPAFADDTAATPAQLRAQADTLNAQADVKADQGAIAKDDVAIVKHSDKLLEHQASHDANKQMGKDGAAAVDSVKAAGSHAAIAAKKGERKIDQKILQHDQNDEADALTKQNNVDVNAGAKVQ